MVVFRLCIASRKITSQRKVLLSKMAADTAKDPTVQELLEQFKDVPEAVRWLEEVLHNPMVLKLFPTIDSDGFTMMVGKELGDKLFNAAHPSKAQYGTWDIF